MHRTPRELGDDRLIIVAYRQLVNLHTLDADLYVDIEERGLVQELLNYVICHAGGTSRTFNDAVDIFAE